MTHRHRLGALLLGVVALAVVVVVSVLLWPDADRDPVPGPRPGDTQIAGGPGATAETAAAGPGVERAPEPGATPEPADAPDDRPRAPVHGRVLLEETGAPARGGSVELACFDAVAEGFTPAEAAALDEEERSFAESYEEAPIQADGAYALDLPVGIVLRRATLKPTTPGVDWFGGFIDTDRDLGDVVVPAEGLELDLVVPEGFFFAGTVLDRATRLPVPGARVSAVWWNLDLSLDADHTDARGRFRIGGFRPEVVARAAFLELLVDAAGYVPARQKVVPAEGARSVEGVTVLLDAGVRIQGRVLDADGRPVAGSPVVLERERAGGAGALLPLALWREATTGEAGDFDLGVVAPADPLFVSARFVRVGPLVPTAQEELVLVQPEVTFLSLELVSDVPWQDGSVTLAVAQDGVEGPGLPPLPTTHDQAGWTTRVVTGRPVTVTARARAADASGETAPLVGRAEVVVGEREEVVQVALRPDRTAPEEQGLRLTLRDAATRRPLAGIPLAVLGDTLRAGEVTPDRRGQVLLDLRPGRQWLELRSPGYRSRSFRVDVGADGFVAAEVRLTAEG